MRDLARVVNVPSTLDPSLKSNHFPTVYPEVSDSSLSFAAASAWA
jgi:hypothetical protein